MKFITLVLSALMVLGVVTAKECYKNGENPKPECDLGGPCEIALEILLQGEVKERIEQCEESGDITKTVCTLDPLVVFQSCFDAITKLITIPKV